MMHGSENTPGPVWYTARILKTYSVSGSSPSAMSACNCRPSLTSNFFLIWCTRKYVVLDAVPFWKAEQLVLLDFLLGRNEVPEVEGTKECGIRGLQLVSDRLFLVHVRCLPVGSYRGLPGWLDTKVLRGAFSS